MSADFHGPRFLSIPVSLTYSRESRIFPRYSRMYTARVKISKQPRNFPRPMIAPMDGNNDGPGVPCGFLPFSLIFSIFSSPLFFFYDVDKARERAPNAVRELVVKRFTEADIAITRHGRDSARLSLRSRYPRISRDTFARERDLKDRAEEKRIRESVSLRGAFVNARGNATRRATPNPVVNGSRPRGARRAISSLEIPATTSLKRP